MDRLDSEQTEGRWTDPSHRQSRISLDVVVVTLFVVVVDALANGFAGGLTVVQPLLALPFVFFLPGYALLSALFPLGRTYEAEEANETRWLFGHGRALTWGERVVLSFGVSLAVLPVLGVVLAVTGIGYSTVAVGNTLAVFILVGMAVGALRRLALRPARLASTGSARYTVPVGRWFGEFERATWRSGSRFDGLLNLTLVVLVLAAVAALALAFAFPPAGESYTGLALLTETAEGDLVASGYPSTLVAGESFDLVVGIDSHERGTTTYTAVTELQRVSTSGTTVEVLERQQLDAFETTLRPEASTREAITVTPGMIGEDLRVVVYLYEGEVPAQPSEETATESVFFWVTVTPEASGGTAGATDSGAATDGTGTGDAGAGAGADTTGTGTPTPTPTPTPTA